MRRASQGPQGLPLIVLTGRIASGHGHAAGPLTRLVELYRRKTGWVLYPGTLNVILEHPWPTPPGFARIERGEDGCRVGVTLIRCRIGGVDAVILRPDSHGTPEGMHGLEVLELAAPVRLRDALSLVDGAPVQVALVADEGCSGGG